MVSHRTPPTSARCDFMPSDTTSTDRLEQRLDWARDQIGVPPGASFHDIRARFFSLVEQENFVPDETLDTAFRTLRWNAEGVIDDDDPAEFLAAEERELLDAVEAFASKMFSLPVDQRRQHWAALRQRAEFALRPRTRLEALAEGLDFDVKTVDSSQGDMRLDTLTRYAMELFPLRPTARAARRYALLQTLHKEDVQPWRKAAQTLQLRHPQVTALAPEFIQQLATTGKPRRAAKAVSVQRGESSGRGGGWGLALAVCILVSFLARAAFRSSDATPSQRPHQANIERLMEEVRKSQAQLPASPPETPAEIPPFSFYPPGYTPPLPSDPPETETENPLSPFAGRERAREILQRHRAEMERIRQEREARMRQYLDRPRTPSWEPRPSGLGPVGPADGDVPPTFRPGLGKSHIPPPSGLGG